MMRANILAGAMVNQERDLYPVSTEQIEAKYQRDRANYEEAHIKAIFIAFKSSTAAGGTTPEDIQAAAKRALEAAHSPSQRTEAEAKTLAGDIANKIRNGADFAKMVAEFSDDESSKASGGDFGVIKPNSSYPEDLRKAVFALSPGQISDPIRQPSGFYILRLDSKSLTPLADVREQIVQTLRQEHLGEFMNQMNTRFRPVVVEQEIFMRPQTVLGQ